jgi:hypothetical protein
MYLSPDMGWMDSLYIFFVLWNGTEWNGVRRDSFREFQHEDGIEKRNLNLKFF